MRISIDGNASIYAHFHFIQKILKMCLTNVLYIIYTITIETANNTYREGTVMTKRFYYTYAYSINEVSHSITNPCYFPTEEEAYERLGKAISELVTFSKNPVIVTKARVSYKYEEVSQ